MDTVLDTSTLPPQRRTAAWRATICETMGPLDLDIQDPAAFGRLDVAAAGVARVVKMRSTASQTVRRTPGAVAKHSNDALRLVVATNGGQVIEQAGRSHRLLPGDVIIYDFDQPYTVDCPSELLDLTAVTFPREALPYGAQALTALSATPFSVEDRQLIAPIVRRIAAGGHTATSAYRFCNILLDVVAASTLDRIQADSASWASRQHAQLIAVQEYIDRHLADPGLSPGAIAAEHFLSLRQLHRVFAKEGLSVAAWIRGRRLARCRRDFADPMQAHVPVSAIGARWGFGDAAQFSRVFRAAHGVPPQEYRRTELMKLAG